MGKMTVDLDTVKSRLGIRAAKHRHLESTTVLIEVITNIIKINAITPEINSLPWLRIINTILILVKATLIIVTD